MATELDGVFTPEPPADPVVGVRFRSMHADVFAHAYSVGVAYVRDSGAIDREETLVLTPQEWGAFLGSIAVPSPRAAAIAALVALGRLPNVTAAPSADSNAVL